MAITTLCAVIATLRVVPNRSQFFQYESVTLSCGPLGNSSGWRVKRNTSTNINESCDSKNETDCSISELYPFDTDVYWCESAAGECSNTVNITVIGAGGVILESPVLPVMEGDSVTLRCRTKTTSSFNLTADFYKDGRLIRSSSTGNLTIHSVSNSDAGLYKCNVSGAGESPDGWLTVRGHPELPDSPFTHILLPVVGFVLVALVALVSVMLLCLWRSHKGKVKRDVSYNNVIITQEVQPNRIRDVDDAESFYSTLQPVNHLTGNINNLTPSAPKNNAWP
ncbi:low affinity immunoglobulin gamma Fc region receptor II isoform X1 [Perca flavescens]|uniref:low affinity immunoglobulin gamma Fc region receptor II isoform X1 n=1 Tax=Perca flavescens TaxID=8167 RepID=UPI00106E9827|nr:low affinity immunoglobulin gamma Fc region receptor II-like isoform X1 [Perca flavescens]